jgi:hypothetical protein
VVLILADEMGAHLSCPGTNGIKTPAVDKLAGKEPAIIMYKN